MISRAIGTATRRTRVEDERKTAGDGYDARADKRDPLHRDSCTRTRIPKHGARTRTDDVPEEMGRMNDAARHSRTIAQLCGRAISSRQNGMKTQRFRTNSTAPIRRHSSNHSAPSRRAKFTPFAASSKAAINGRGSFNHARSFRFCCCCLLPIDLEWGTATLSNSTDPSVETCWKPGGSLSCLS